MASSQVGGFGLELTLNEPRPGMGDEERRGFRRRATAIHAMWGLAFGYVVLHPVAMATFRWFELRTSPAVVVLREALMASAVGPGEGTVLVDDKVPPGLVVDCDPALIVRVVANLVVNAVKHIGDNVMDNQVGHIVLALVVEDEPSYARLIAEVLEEDGYSVTTASDGVEALEIVHAQRPDVITLDIQMPRKGGIQFYRELKSDPEFNEIPVVVVTGITRDDRDMENFVRMFLEVEHLPMPDAYMEKPVDNEELLRVIHDALRSDTPR